MHGTGIGNFVTILQTRDTNYSYYIFVGKPEWFEDATAIIKQVAQKYNLKDWHKKYWQERPALVAKEEKKFIEEKNKKPRGLLARIFG